FANFRRLVPHYEVVPFGRCDFLVSLLIDINLIRSKWKTPDAVSSFKIVHFYFIPQMSYKHNLIESTIHLLLNLIETKYTKVSPQSPTVSRKLKSAAGNGSSLISSEETPFSSAPFTLIFQKLKCRC